MVRSIVRIASLMGIAVLALIGMSANLTPLSVVSAVAEGVGQPKSKLKELLEERAAITRDASKLAKERFKVGQGSFEESLEPMRLELEAALDLCESAKERVAVLEKFLAAAKDNENMAAQFVKAGQGRPGSAPVAKAERLRIEIALERAKTKATAKPANVPQASPELQDHVDLAEKNAAIRRAAIKVVEAQKARVIANLAIVKAQLAQAKADEAFADQQYQRLTELVRTKSIEPRLVNEQHAKVDAVKAQRVTAESAVAEAESHVAIEDARLAQAHLEFEEAELRVKHLKARLQRQ